VTYARSTKALPPQTVEIKPHPHGVELGVLIAMLKDTTCRSLSGFLQEEFSRVGPKVAEEICKLAKLSPKAYPTRIAREEASALHSAIQKTKISSPPTNCISPIGEELVLSGLKKEIEADFYVAITRPPAVYRGNPFQIEVGIAYGKPGGVGLEMTDEGRIEKRKTTVQTEELVGNADEPIRVLRFANRVPLLYQQAACAVTKAVIATNWRAYGMQQPKGGLPVGPVRRARAHRERVGAVHERVQGSAGGLPRDPEGAAPRAPGRGPQARRLHPQGQAPAVGVPEAQLHREVHPPHRDRLAGDPRPGRPRARSDRERARGRAQQEPQVLGVRHDSERFAERAGNAVRAGRIVRNRA
jgi:hypothetical protein